MMLSNLKKIAVADHKSEVTDCVIGVPVDWTEEQRNTILDAAELAGLKCLSLINEVTPASLEIGVQGSGFRV
jgi:heat shock protein 4